MSMLVRLSGASLRLVGNTVVTKGWGTLFTPKEYAENVADVGDYIVEVKGRVVEEAQFEEHPVPFVAGERYSHQHDSVCGWLLCYEVADGFMGQYNTDVPNPDHQFTFFNKQGKSKHFQLNAKTKRVSVGRKKVLKPL